MKRRTHRNSMAAYHSTDFSEREALIISCLRASSVPLTDAEVCARLGFGDNKLKVSPRITELIDQHVLAECGDVKCATTGKTVRTVGIAAPIQQSLV